MSIASAYRILDDSIIHYRGQPVGTVAAIGPNPAVANYHECFVRDFVPSALVFLLDGRAEIVHNLNTLNDVIHSPRRCGAQPGALYQ